IGKISREEMIKEIRQATAEHKARLTQNIADYQTRLAKITELANSQENQLATIKETLNVNETDSGTVLEDEEKVAKEEAADKISSEVPVDQKQRESSVFLYDSVTGKSAVVVNLRDAIKSWRSRSIPAALFESSAITFEVSDSLIESIFADSETVDTFFEE
ncbi:MAG: hypothetical protein IKW74_02185, partial [Thermoguttaceae bacterium]|nr:hypothetical protein [Thermoguttaceae bacterium]